MGCGSGFEVPSDVIEGTLTPNTMPIATAPHTLGDSYIGQGDEATAASWFRQLAFASKGLHESSISMPNVAGLPTPYPDLANVQELVLAANKTLQQPASWRPGMNFFVRVLQSNRSLLVFTSNYKFPYDVAPDLSQTDSSKAWFWFRADSFNANQWICVDMILGIDALNPGNSPIIKPPFELYPVTYTDMSAAFTGKNKVLFSIPARGLIKRVLIVPDTAFMGEFGVFAGYTLSLGVDQNPGFADYAKQYLPDFDVLTDPGTRAAKAEVNDMPSWGAAINFLVRAESFGATLDQATQGKAWIYVERLTIPVKPL